MGALQYCIGSVLVILVLDILPDDEATNTEAVWKIICKRYRDKATPTQYSNFKVGTFANEKKCAALSHA